MKLKDIVDGYTKGDILKIISNIDRRINITQEVTDITKVIFVDMKKDFTNWVKPSHYLVSYKWNSLDGENEHGYSIKDGLGHCEVVDLKRQVREVKMNELLNEI